VCSSDLYFFGRNVSREVSVGSTKVGELRADEVVEPTAFAPSAKLFLDHRRRTI